MVVRDTGKCTGCGTCVKICHEHCMSVVDKKIQIDYRYCSTCSQCIAICPSQALAWDKVESKRFNPLLMPSAEQMDELFKERRTLRDFRQAPVDRKTLERLAGYAAYAPTHSHGFRIVIIDDPGIIELMDRILVRFSTRIYNLFFKPRLFTHLVSLAKPSMREEYLRAKPKLETVIKRGTVFSSRPPAFLMVVGDKRVPLNLESAQYAVYNITLLAGALGLGCRNLVGNQPILNADCALRNKLHLLKSERIFGLMGVGYPSVKFRNKVEGRLIPIQWNAG